MNILSPNETQLMRALCTKKLKLREQRKAGLAGIIKNLRMINRSASRTTESLFSSVQNLAST